MGILATDIKADERGWKRFARLARRVAFGRAVASGGFWIRINAKERSSEGSEEEFVPQISIRFTQIKSIRSSVFI
jgi:hypothetical protein